MFKKLKCTINHKTNKQTIEYRVYKTESVYTTCSPRKWLHLDLEDRTSDKDIDDANCLLIMFKIKNSINKQVDLNIKVKEYINNSCTREEAYYAFAVQNNITQYEKRFGKTVICTK